MIEEDSIGRMYDVRLAGRLAGYLKPYIAWATASVILLIIHSSLAVTGPYLTKIIIDHYLAPTNVTASPIDTWLPQDAFVGLNVVAGLYLAVLVCGFLIRYGQITVMQHIGQKVIRDLRVKIFSHLHRMSIAFFDRNAVEQLVTRTTTDVDTLNKMFTSEVVAIFGDLLTFAFILAAMTHLSPELTMICCSVAPLVILISVWFRKRVRANFREVRLAVAKVNTLLQEHFRGIAAIQLFCRETESEREFYLANNDYHAAHYRSTRAHAYFYPTIEWLGVVGVVVVLVYGGMQTVNGSLTIGIIVAFIQYGTRVFRPIQDLSAKYTILQAAMASAERIFKLLDTPPDQTASECTSNNDLTNTTREPETSDLGIEFQNVSFAYKDNHRVLRDVSFRIRAGETVAFVGHTGAGKTTLLSLLLRFYEPQEGRILLNGRDIRNWSIERLRRSFGVVLQDPYLFTNTVGRNIRFANETISEKRLLQLAENMNLEELFESLPAGFDEPLVKGGSSFSAGEKQLISFARALASDPQFLILDEATSSVDTDTELKIRKAFSRMVAGHTAIVIAHRLSTIQRADRIIVMHKGTIHETGTHRYLMSKKGIYWKLYQMKYRDQKNAEEVQAQ